MLFQKKKIGTPITKSFYALGTINTISVYDTAFENILEQAIEKVSDIDNEMSAFKEESDVSRINQNAGKSAQYVCEDTFFVIKKAVEYADMTEHSSDITIRPLVNLWHDYLEKSQTPPQEEIEKALNLVNYKDIIIDENAQTIGLKREYQAIDLGSIAKGYAADQVKKIFSESKVKNALINLGGNVIVMGNASDGKKWKVGIQNPDKEQGISMGVIALKNKTIVTSGGYERFFVIDGKKYHHIIDPNSGYPSQNGIKSATIIANESIGADALTTSLFVLGFEKAKELVDRIPNLDAIIITDENEVYLTKDIFHKFDLIDENYQFMKRNE